QVDVRELLQHEVQQLGSREAVDLYVEVERLEDVPHVRRERVDVREQVGRDVVGVAPDRLEVQLVRVVEQLSRGTLQKWFEHHPCPGPLPHLGQHLGFRGRQYAVEAAEHREGKYDLPVLGLLIVAAEQVGDGPDEGGEVRVTHS